MPPSRYWAMLTTAYLVPVGRLQCLHRYADDERQPQQRRTAAVDVRLTVQNLDPRVVSNRNQSLHSFCCYCCSAGCCSICCFRSKRRESERELRLSVRRRRCCNATPHHPAESSARGSPQRAGRYGRRPSGAGAPPHSRRCTGSGCRCCSRSRPNSRRG
eukprot:COSAG06_NODE_10759_length_1622_cov_1.306632_2_plen_159_part_00